jgi:antitoxin ParD1/3/4
MATTTMNISLPDSMKTFVDERLANDSYGSASEYVRELIRSDQKWVEQEKLEKLLLERLESKNTRPWNVDELKAELMRRKKK